MRAEDYTWFLTLASIQNLSEAADLLAMPQPTLSRRLARLESRLGTELFDRGGRRLRLNDRGRVIEAAFRDAQQSLDRGEAELRRLLDPVTGRVRFGFLPSLGPWLAPRVIRSFLSRHPKADVVLSQATAEALVMALHAGELDVALCAPDVVPELLGGLTIHTVHRQAMAIVVPEGHRLAPRTSVRFEEVVGESFVAAPPGYTTRNILDRLARGTKLRIVLESESLATHAGLASSGIGLALLPVDDPSLHVPGAVFLPLDTNDKREIALVWRAEDVPVVASFVAEVSSEFRGEP
ncbi:LysR family transcriptional regulator [Flaviflexus equikiangi]|uniref:LysR family transcriptional regulator n=1 Tax=Flaviflexus equikiangi TaxID=2758573 RepID=A0ABS2TH47_9ACTO|nr:LysR family transcriptional regulator [Flaviflexus equikiangi]MBM9433988.1 LysR family transcriptional regulator [Flaviflexus equikiangi]